MRPPAQPDTIASHTNIATLRVVTYNAHKGIGGLDRRYRPDRIIETLRAQDADVVLMQEIDDNVPRSGCHRQVDLFADALEFPFSAYQKNVAVKQGHYGNAILCRFPLTDIENLDLTIRFKKRRQALIANCMVPIGGQEVPVVFVNFHLGLAGFERRIQVNQVLQNNTVQSMPTSSPIIVAGDCNDYLGTLSHRIMAPAGFTSAGTGQRTFPACLPVATLDYIYYRGNLSLQAAFTPQSKVASRASDHLPLVADFCLPLTASNSQ